MKKKLDLESIYLRLPVSIQNIATSIEGWRLKKRRYGTDFSATFRKVIERDKLPQEMLLSYQRQTLRCFLNSASQTLFWNRRFKEHNISIDAEDVISQISKLPILTKQEVKDCYEEFKIPELPISTLIPCHTSGSTGSGLVFYTKRESEIEQWAVWWRYRNWHAIELDTWCGYFGGRSIVPLSQSTPPFWRTNYPGRQLMFSAYHLKPETVKTYVDVLRNHNIPWLHGYPSILSLLASYILDQGLEPLPALRIITTGAESLMPQQRSIIERGFGVLIFQHYGQAEGVANISECEHGRLHVDEDYSLVEFVPVEDTNNSYRIIGTNWSNSVFPLIRYDTGDIATLPEDDLPCPCGRQWRQVLDIDGRQEDFVILPSGAHIGRLDHIFKDLMHINESQIYQSAPGAVIFRIVKGSGYDNTGEEARLLREARKRLGEELKITINYVNQIPRTKSGKLRFVVSEIKPVNGT